MFPKPPVEGHLHIIAWHEHLSNVFTDMRSSTSPSSAAVITAENIRNIEKDQKNSEKAIMNGRPRSAEEAIPVALLHPILAQFVKDCKDLEPTKDDNSLVLTLLQEMPKLFQLEANRVEKVKEIFKNAGIELDPGHINRYTVDLCRESRNSPYHDFSFIMEVKVELGSTNSEPYFEACFYYNEANRAYFDKKGNRSNARRPCLLMILTGESL